MLTILFRGSQSPSLGTPRYYFRGYNHLKWGGKEPGEGGKFSSAIRKRMKNSFARMIVSLQRSNVRARVNTFIGGRGNRSVDMKESRAGSDPWTEMIWFILFLPGLVNQVYGYHINFNYFLTYKLAKFVIFFLAHGLTYFLTKKMYILRWKFMLLLCKMFIKAFKA